MIKPGMLADELGELLRRIAMASVAAPAKRRFDTRLDDDCLSGQPSQEVDELAVELRVLRK